MIQGVKTDLQVMQNTRTSGELKGRRTPVVSRVKVRVRVRVVMQPLNSHEIRHNLEIFASRSIEPFIEVCRVHFIISHDIRRLAQGGKRTAQAWSGKSGTRFEIRALVQCPCGRQPDGKDGQCAGMSSWAAAGASSCDVAPWSRIKHVPRRVSIVSSVSQQGLHRRGPYWVEKSPAERTVSVSSA